MICKIRKWELSDAKELAAALSNKNIQDNLRDGLPYPYTEQDGVDFISSMLSTDENDTFAFAIMVDNKVIGGINLLEKFIGVDWGEGQRCGKRKVKSNSLATILKIACII